MSAWEGGRLENQAKIARSNGLGHRRTTPRPPNGLFGNRPDRLRIRVHFLYHRRVRACMRRERRLRPGDTSLARSLLSSLPSTFQVIRLTDNKQLTRALSPAAMDAAILDRGVMFVVVRSTEMEKCPCFRSFRFRQSELLVMPKCGSSHPGLTTRARVAAFIMLWQLICFRSFPRGGCPFPRLTARHPSQKLTGLFIHHFPSTSSRPTRRNGHVCECPPSLRDDADASFPSSLSNT